MKEIKLQVLSTTFIIDSIKFLILKPQEQFNFFAGQYLVFKLADKVSRSYSIASQPGIDEIEFVIGINKDGVGSSLINYLKVNDYVDAIGPLGFFTIEKNVKNIDDNDSFIFIATGTGIAPIRSIIKDLLINKKIKNKINLFFGLRYDNQAYFFDEFNNLANKYSNFIFTPVISRPSSNWAGEVGHCQDVMKNFDLNKNSFVYICGSTQNVLSINEFLLNFGFNKNRIFYEKFG